MISKIDMEEISHTEPEWGFEPGSARYKATALPFELSSIDKYKKVMFTVLVMLQGSFRSSLLGQVNNPR